MSGTKILLSLAAAGALLGAGAAGGLHLHKTRDQTPAKLAECQGRQQDLQKKGTLLLIRNLLLEAEVGHLRGNDGFAFERVVRAQLMATDSAPEHTGAIEDLQSLLLRQDPKVKDQLLAVAEKILPLSAPEQPAASPAPAGKAPAPAPAPRAESPAAPPAPKAEAPPAAPGPRAPKAEPGAPAPPASGTASGVSVPLGAGGARDEAYRALLDAKTALLAGEAGVVAKLARARVMLDEAGRSDLGQELDAALQAARRKEDGKARAAMDSVLAKLR